MREPRRLLAWGLAILLVACAAPAAAKKKPRAIEPEELTNLFLSPKYAQWLIGPITWMTTDEEREHYLGLTRDEEAERFIEAFWRQRDPEPEEPGNPLRETFEERAAEADKLYSESAYSGRRTARGAIYVLYGPPRETDYEIAPYAGGPPIEVWEYPKDAAEGLDGRQPDAKYRFIKEGDLTVFYIPGRQRQQDRRRDLLRPPDPTRPYGR